MTSILLAERAGPDARILVLGAGGGLELEALAGEHPGWRFDGVDPSAPMLEAARRRAAAHAARTRLHEGYVDAAPEGPFDGAACLLTLHFVPRKERRSTLRQVRRRLAPGAAFVAAHMSFPQDEPERAAWIDRHLAFSGTDPAHVEDARRAIATRLTALSPEEDEAMLREAGFSGVRLFYAGLSFRGWVGYAAT